jgi:hypothetical protein
MNAITAVWKNGQIVPNEPVDWPEGSQLLVEPLETRGEKLGLDESDWDDSPEGIAEWVAAVEKIEPMVWAEGEEDDYQRWREEIKKYTIEAVGKQMEEWGRGDAP